MAHLVRMGHPWVYRDALAGRPVSAAAGDAIDLLDPDGAFVGRGLFDPAGNIAVRVFTRVAGENVDPALFRERVRQAMALRQATLDLEHLTAYRVINAESDGLPGCCADRYGDFLVVHLFSQLWLPCREAMLDILAQETGVLGIYEQRRFRSLAGEGAAAPAKLVRGQIAPLEIEVVEGDLRFAVDVTAPLSVGLFPDLREGRKAVAAHAQGREVLNLFAYTGAFTAYGLAGGARHVTAVDLSSRSHGRGRHNLALSGLDPDRCTAITGDAFSVLAQLAERRRQFGLVVVDPPAFATGKGRVFSAVRDYRDLCQAAIGVLAPGGRLAAASSTSRLSAADLDRALAEAAARAGADLRIVERRGLPPDYPVSPAFPEGNYLKFVVAVRV